MYFFTAYISNVINFIPSHKQQTATFRVAVRYFAVDTKRRRDVSRLLGVIIVGLSIFPGYEDRSLLVINAPRQATKIA